LENYELIAEKAYKEIIKNSQAKDLIKKYKEEK
jgi:hypothetical protein